MADYLTYSELKVGEEFGPLRHVFTNELIASYCQDWADDNPLYLAGSSQDRPLAPITYDTGRMGSDLLESKFNMGRTIVTRSAQRNVRPISLGQTITTLGRVEEKYIKRGYEYVVVSFVSYDETGQIVRTGFDHLALSLERRPDEKVAG